MYTKLCTYLHHILLINCSIQFSSGGFELFQADIDSLESERGELKDKMKQMSKKALIQGLSKSQGLPEGPSSLGPSVPSPVRDSPLLVQQLADMRAAVSSLQSSRAR